MTATSNLDIAALKQAISASAQDRSSLQTAKQHLESCAKAAASSQDLELAQCADTFSQLVELIELSSDDRLSKEIQEFVLSSLDAIAADSAETTNFFDDAHDRYRQYLAPYEDMQVHQEHEDIWNEADSTVPKSTDEPSNSAEQMQLMLSAVASGEAASELATIESSQPSVEPSQPTSTTEPEDNIVDLRNDEDLREAFMDDASRCLDSMDECVLSAEQRPATSEIVQQFCRELHTLKGASASVGLALLAAKIHDTESALATDLPADQVANLMNAIVGQIRLVIQSLQSPEPSASANAPTAAVTETLSSADFNAGPAEDALVRIRASKLDRLMDMLGELVVLRNRRESHHSDFAEFNLELNRCASRLNFFVQDPDNGSESMSSSCTLAEMSKDVSDLASESRELQKPISKDNLAISHFIRDFRHELMQLRRIPLSGLFNRVQRSAREAAKTEGKQITFHIEGDDSGLERELQEKLFEPLLHVVRNAVSHGIESPQQRQQFGKNAAGLITLKAQSNSQMVVISITDDGQGLDYDAIRKRGIEKGLIGPNQIVNEHELGKLIFHPGFSTRTAANSVAGRGVGMDVVTNVLQQMRGRIEITSQPGQGTTMMVVIPVQSGIEHVMVFRSGSQLFALPMQAVAKVKSAATNNASTVNMAAVLGKTDVPNHNAGEVLMLRSHRTRENKRSAFQVDEILGPEEVVIRKLPPLMNSHPLFCGMTLSGAGETALLLDADRLSQFSLNLGAIENNVADSVSEQQTRLLVVDDSMSARKLLSKKLIQHGFHVTEAADGLEALEKIRNQKFELVFTDLDMPRLGGLELLFDLQQGQHKEQKVVVVSSRDANEFHDRATELGAKGYLSKPVEDETLNQLLRELGLLTNA